jgi:hypothetical protein
MNAKLQHDIELLAREFAAKVTRLVADAIVSEVESALASAPPVAGPGRAAEAPAAKPRRLAASPVEHWVPDRRARRVPKFVIESTGLQTKREIVDRYGEHARFEKGQPSPPPLRQARAGGED